MKNIDGEIIQVNRMIKLLNRCLAINIKTSEIEAAKNCLKDIQMLKKELQHLEDIKHSIVTNAAVTKAKKEPFGDEIQRSRTGFLR